MKMDLAKVRGCLAVSILLLLLLVDDTAACYCLASPPVPLQTAYCTSDVVMSGTFVDSRFPNKDDMTWAVYEFKVNKVFKGSAAVGEKVDLYTQVLGTTCEYKHDGPFTEDTYVVGGRLDGDHIVISVCSLIKKEAQITPDEMKGLEGGFSSGCN